MLAYKAMKTTKQHLKLYIIFNHKISIMKHFLIITVALFSLKAASQDVIFAGTTFRFENTAIGLNAGLKKDFADKLNWNVKAV